MRRCRIARRAGVARGGPAADRNAAAPSADRAGAPAAVGPAVRSAVAAAALVVVGHGEKDTGSADGLTIAELRGEISMAKRSGKRKLRAECIAAVFGVHECRCPPTVLGGTGFKVCSAVSYFSTRVGSIIGAGRLSFRVRDGSGRFPAAMDRRNCIHSFLSAPLFLWGEVCGPRVLVVGCGHCCLTVWCGCEVLLLL